MPLQWLGFSISGLNALERGNTYACHWHSEETAGIANHLTVDGYLEGVLRELSVIN